MTKKSNSYNLDSEKMVALLRIGKLDEQINNRETPQVNLEEAIMFHLSHPMPLKGIVRKCATAIPELVTNALYVCNSKCVGRLLQDHDTSIGQLEELKSVYRRSSMKAMPSENKTAAVAIYYAAIAKALVSHGQKISTFSYKQLNRAFTALIKKQWIPDYIKQLYRQAAKICQEKQDVQPKA